MFRQVWVYAYDVLDQVNVVVRYQQSQDPNTHSAVWDTVVHTEFPSVGEANNDQWMKDALIAALERL